MTPATGKTSLTVDGLLQRAVSQGASDLHLTQGERPRLRLHGDLETLRDLPVLGQEEFSVLLSSLLNEDQTQALKVAGTVDLARGLPGGERFRFNVFAERGGAAIAVRRLEDQLRPLDELRLPASLARLEAAHDGLVLLTGPTGSGKSTTLATLINGINRYQAKHIVTLEDPIEYVHTSRKSLVHQRELHTHFQDFPSALRAVLREDPDVILVGEMRDPPTMRAALMAAETGHLVFSTLHSGSAVGATERLVGAFPGPERDSIRHQLSLVLKTVVAQRLLAPRSGGARVPIVEILWVTPAVAHLIRAGKTAQIHSTMEGQTGDGMRTQEQALAEAVLRRWIAEDVARGAARVPQLFAERLRHLRRARTSEADRS